MKTSHNISATNNPGYGLAHGTMAGLPRLSHIPYGDGRATARSGQGGAWSSDRFPNEVGFLNTLNIC